MHALILANGDFPPIELIRQLRGDADLFIATDGAANALHAHQEAPDVVLGDMDSMCPDVAAQLPESVLLPAIDQEASDLDKAISYAKERGAKRVTLIGSAGGRVDHTLTAASLLLKYRTELPILIRLPTSTIQLADRKTVIQGNSGDIISLIVFSTVEGVSLEGVAWPLRDETLLPGSRGVSNRLIQSKAVLSIRSGWLLVCHLFGEHKADGGEP